MQRFLETHEDWCLVSGELVGRTQEENEAETARLLATILDRGFPALRVEGVYRGVAEQSFLVLGIDSSEALELARSFSQESVMTSSGLAYCDGGEVIPIRGISQGATGDCFSRIFVAGVARDLTISLVA